MSKRLLEEVGEEVEEDVVNGDNEQNVDDDDDDEEEEEEEEEEVATTSTTTTTASSATALTAKRQKQKKKSAYFKQLRLERAQYSHGNYPGYYTFRNGKQGVKADYRLRAFRRAWFEDRDGLDIGANSGELTLEMARRFRARSMLGVEIDATLVAEAKTHRKAHFNREQLRRLDGAPPLAPTHVDDERMQAAPYAGAITFPFFPDAVTERGTKTPSDADILSQVMEEAAAKEGVKYDATAATATATATAATDTTTTASQPDAAAAAAAAAAATADAAAADATAAFPLNVGFRCVDVSAAPAADEPESALLGAAAFDVITCLSVVKWVHLNAGDEGVRRLFRRCYAALRVNGVFVLEPQPWSSYEKKKKLTPQIRANFDAIQLKPDDFPRFLVEEVGFRDFRELHFSPPKNTEGHLGGGFTKRSMLVFRKY